MIVMMLSAPVWAGNNGIITKPSKYSVPDTIGRLEKVVKAKGFTIFAMIDHAAAAKRDGLTMPPTQLLIFGNPKGGTPLMLAAPTTAIDLPLKALAWQDAAGKVWLSYNTAEYLKERHDIKGKDAAIKHLDGALDAMTTKALE
jgi:uncharacterized protein (DUF302 family)